MAESKFSKNIIKLKCPTCKQVNYYTRKNRKLVTKKIETQKFCKKCRKRTLHKEAKK